MVQGSDSEVIGVVGMRIVNARWTPTVNVMVILCDCGKEFDHRADRWRVVCPECKRRANLGYLRENCIELRRSYDRQDNSIQGR